MDDKTLGSMPDEVEGIASHQRQHFLVGRVEGLNIGGFHDFHGFDAILEFPAKGGNSDFITLANVTKWAKECISVTSNTCVASFPKEGGARDVTGRPLKIANVRSFHDH